MAPPDPDGPFDPLCIRIHQRAFWVNIQAINFGGSSRFVQKKGPEIRHFEMGDTWLIHMNNSGPVVGRVRARHFLLYRLLWHFLCRESALFPCPNSSIGSSLISDS